jgi:ABC-2 type transport system ATP-binding protein
MAAVEISEVTKTFGVVRAVDNLTLSVPEGAIYGFIGPNGSGKTTTMRMIVNIFYPDSGAIRVFGEAMTPARTGLIGYLPEERGLYKTMAVKAILEFYGELRGGRNVSAEVDRWLDRFGLSEWGPRKLETLSKGMTQRVQFIAAVIGSPRLLILDEPFSGLDPVSAEALREAVIDLRKSGATIILSTHDMRTAETLCDSILMIFRGSKVLDGTLEDIQSQYGNDTIRLSAAGGADALGELPGIESVRDLGQVQELRIGHGHDPQDILRMLIARTRVESFTIARPSLDDIFVRIAGPEGERAQNA